MRVRISANPPLPPVKAWFPLTHSAQTIATFKSTLCISIPALHDFSPRTLHLSIDGFELLDSSELDILRDGDLICIDVLDAPAREPAQRPDASRKRKRPLSSSSSSSSESESDTSTESNTETASAESESDSDASSHPATPFVRQAEPPKARLKPTPSAPPPATFVPPGYGKPQTRSRNLRRRLKRVHEHKAACEDGPVSGANAAVQSENGRVPDANGDGHAMPALMSLSLRNKNKAKNFKSFINKPLPPKIIFAEQEGDATAFTATPRVMPRLIPPSSRASLPPNMFVTSVDVEAGFHREERKENMQIEYGDELEKKSDGDDAPESEVDVERLESIAEQQWNTLAKLTHEKQVEPGVIVGYQGLGINPETYTPEQVLTVGVVTWCGEDGVDVQPLRAVSFSGPVDGEATRYTWDDIEYGEWKIIPSK